MDAHLIQIFAFGRSPRSASVKIKKMTGAYFTIKTRKLKIVLDACNIDFYEKMQRTKVLAL